MSITMENIQGCLLKLKSYISIMSDVYVFLTTNVAFN